MVSPVRVTIVGAPVACGDGVKDPWRELSHWVAGQLRRRFGHAVQVEYYDLFDAACPPLPSDAALPLVLVDGEMLSGGGKLSLPLIRRAVEALGATPVVPEGVVPMIASRGGAVLRSTPPGLHAAPPSSR